MIVFESSAIDCSTYRNEVMPFYLGNFYAADEDRMIGEYPLVQERFYIRTTKDGPTSTWSMKMHSSNELDTSCWPGIQQGSNFKTEAKWDVALLLNKFLPDKGVVAESAETIHRQDRCSFPHRKGWSKLIHDNDKVEIIRRQWWAHARTSPSA